MPLLQVLAGMSPDRQHALLKPTVVLGRDPGCDVLLHDGKASRFHAELLEDESGTWFLRDRGSSNGTARNGVRVGRMPERLADRDEIRIGDTLLRFLLAAPPAEDEEDDPLAGDVYASDTLIHPLQTQRFPLLFADKPDGVHALRFLLDLANAVEEADNPEQLARVLADGLSESVVADRVFLFMGRDESMRPVPWEPEPELRALYTKPHSGSILRRAVRERVAVLSRTREDERFRDAASVERSQITSAICVPLLVGEELLGAIYLDRLNQEGAFSASDLELSAAAGVQCSMALLNLRRLDGLRASRDQLETELTGCDGFLGQSPAIRDVYTFIQRAAPTDAGVLIHGESGTGKELVARALHKQSPRVDRPFVIVNCAALADSLAEAELFGHERGAFTGADKARPGRFASADGGTIFLDEVGELGEAVQAKLLRVLESGEIAPVGDARVRHVDVRVLAATNRDLAQEVEAGRFRRDLYYRLNILRIELPPLRARGAEDIRLLVEHFVAFLGARCGRPHVRISAALMEKCVAYAWPGNVRELRNAVERMVILARGEELDVGDLPPEIGGMSGAYRHSDPGARQGGAGADAGAGQGGVEEDPARLCSLSEMERGHIRRVLAACGGQKKRAAELLGIDRSTLYAKIRQYDLAGDA